MKERVAKIFILFAVMVLTACGAQTAIHTDTESHIFAETAEEDTPKTAEIKAALSWQEAYAALLRANYAEERISDCGNFGGFDRFFLHDMDLDGIPEMFVINSIDEIVTVYTFRNDEIASLSHGEEIFLVEFLHGAARTYIGAPPPGVPGFVSMSMGPSAGMFGTSALYWRVVIDEDSLVISDVGEWRIDYAALHDLFDDFGFDTDEDVLDAAIKEHTYITINDNPATEEELDNLFDRGFSEFWPRFADVNEDNIQSVIFGIYESLDDKPIEYTTLENGTRVDKRISDEITDLIFRHFEAIENGDVAAFRQTLMGQDGVSHNAHIGLIMTYFGDIIFTDYDAELYGDAGFGLTELGSQRVFGDEFAPINRNTGMFIKEMTYDDWHIEVILSSRSHEQLTFHVTLMSEEYGKPTRRHGVEWHTPTFRWWE